MPVIAGIDEAGYGPTLGPLVLTATAFRIVDGTYNGSSLPCNDLWSKLSDSVVKEVKRYSDRLAVGDSKKLYSAGLKNSGRGLRLLEEAVLSFSSIAVPFVKNRFSITFSDLLKEVSLAMRDYANDYPWYINRDVQLPLASDENDIAKKSRRLRDNLKAAGVEFCRPYCFPVPAGDFNKEVRVTGNKSLFLFNKSAELLLKLWERFANRYDSLHVFVDKQGGRNKYGFLLYKAFARANTFRAMGENCSLNILEEGREVSSYRIQIGGKQMFVSFVKGADDLYMPVALASMFSKYIRELHLRLFNDFWLEHLPNVKPTAGYPQDAKRFLAQIEDMRYQLGIDCDLLVRIK